MMALALRFSESHYKAMDVMEVVNTYAEVARGLVMKRVSEGPVELSTLQCLCLLSLVDFTSMSLTSAQLISLTSPQMAIPIALVFTAALR